MDNIELFKKQLEKAEIKAKIEEIGEVVEIKDGIAKVSGLENVENFELVTFEATGEGQGKKKNISGLVLNLEEYEVGIAVMGDFSLIKEGDVVKRTKNVLSVPVGESLLGRVVDPLGNPIDEKGEIKTNHYLPVERIAPSVIDRAPVNAAMHTGVLAVDALIPIGRGQRELILGDRGSGKTALALDVILNQKEEKNRPVCIYVCCGQKKSKIKRLIKTLEEKGSLEYTIVVCAFTDDPASFLYLAPYSGVSMGEYFRDNGKDALVVYDDLTKHAWAWREISLVLRRPPGREAYPGDIFYLHSRLLERAAKLSKEKGGGSLTALPIIETQAGDISGYIPTNVISICDGQIFLDSALFLKGHKPAIDVGRSVSRVGSKAQVPAMKKTAGTLKLDLAQFEELERFSEFTEELEENTKKLIERGKILREILKQEDLHPLPLEEEIAIIFSAVNGHLNTLGIEKIEDFKKDLIDEIKTLKPEILRGIREGGELDEKNKADLEKIIKNLIEKR